MRTARRNHPARRAVAAACLLAVWAGGCQGPEQVAPIGYCLPRPQDLARMDRVVMVELSYDGRYHRLGEQMSRSLCRAIQDRQLFHVELVGRDDPRLDGLTEKLERCKTLKDLAMIQRALCCDAVIVGSVRHYEPYPRMQVSLYLQLLDLKQGRLVWGLEHTWDTSDRGTEARIRRHFRRRVREGYDPLDWHLTTISPRFFRKYVACEVAETLEPGPPPPQGGGPPA